MTLQCQGHDSPVDFTSYCMQMKEVISLQEV